MSGLTRTNKQLYTILSDTAGTNLTLSNGNMPVVLQSSTGTDIGDVGITSIDSGVSMNVVLQPSTGTDIGTVDICIGTQSLPTTTTLGANAGVNIGDVGFADTCLNVVLQTSTGIDIGTVDVCIGTQLLPVTIANGVTLASGGGGATETVELGIVSISGTAATEVSPGDTYGAEAGSSLIGVQVAQGTGSHTAGGALDSIVDSISTYGAVAIGTNGVMYTANLGAEPVRTQIFSFNNVNSAENGFLSDNSFTSQATTNQSCHDITTGTGLVNLVMKCKTPAGADASATFKVWFSNISGHSDADASGILMETPLTIETDSNGVAFAAFNDLAAPYISLQKTANNGTDICMNLWIYTK